MNKLSKFLIWFATLIMMFNTAYSQVTAKHPKVIEVEMMITKEAMAFLKQRIPAGPVYVNVEVEPLRRNADSNNEQLPYFYSEDEVGDEWDAIDTPIVVLLARIKKATVKVEVPGPTSDMEIVDLKEKLYEQLKLIPGRDSITIDKKTIPPVPVKKVKKDYTVYFFIAAMTLFIFIGIFVLLRWGSKTVTPPAPMQSTPSAIPPTPVSSKPNSQSVKSGNIGGAITSNVNGEINFKDSIKAAEMLKAKLKEVIEAPIFPRLTDMLILDELSNKSLNSFGAFILEMPRSAQQSIFFRSKSDKWFKGFLEATTVNMDCFVAIEKILRNRTELGTKKWEELLIQVWRLDDDAVTLLKQIPTDDAFIILSHLPKTLSVPLAKKAFPGGWAKVLETKDYEPISDEARLDDYLNRSLMLKPYFDFKSIEEYRKDLELIEYLRHTTIKDEEEVYESLNPHSHVHKLRPPFYAVFNSDDEDFKTLFSQYDLQDWALAAFNSPRDSMKKIFAELDDKKKYLFSSYLKQLDEGQISTENQIDKREEIARTYYNLISQKKNLKLFAGKQTSSEGQDETQAA